MRSRRGDGAALSIIIVMVMVALFVLGRMSAESTLTRQFCTLMFGHGLGYMDCIVSKPWKTVDSQRDSSLD